MAPPEHPMAYKTLADRHSMVKRIDDLISKNPKMNFHKSVHVERRDYLPTWSYCEPYHPYSGRCAGLDIYPSSPLEDWNLAKCKDERELFRGRSIGLALARFYTLAIFYHGHLSHGDILDNLPGMYQGRCRDSSVRVLITDLKKVNTKIYNDMIANSIKPITLYFLKNPAWVTPDVDGQLPLFFERADRIRYFRTCLAQEPWIVAWWLFKAIPFMLNIPWLYHSTKHEDLELETLRQELVRFFEERFLILVDAVYLCLIDQDTTKTAKWDQYKGGVKLSMRTLCTHPALVDITPKLDVFPTYSVDLLSVHNIWRRRGPDQEADEDDEMMP